jgi:hypothetical protein
MRTKTRILPVIAASKTFGGILLVAALLASPAIASIPLLGHADQTQLSGATYQLHWNLGIYPSGIPYLIEATAQSDGTPDISGGQEFDIIRGAFDKWAGVATSKIAYQFNGIVESSGQPGQLNAGTLDYVNAVGFESNSAWAKAGVLALTIPVARDNSDPSKAGELLEADILLVDSPDIQWLVTGANALTSAQTTKIKINLEEVVAREIGHFSGLNASLVRTSYENPLLVAEEGIIYLDRRKGPFASTSLMYPYALSGSPSRSANKANTLLSSDEIAAISALYPTTQAASSLGSISGRIRVFDPSDLSTSELCGAHVMAVQADSYQPVAGTLSRPDGTYSIAGLPAGSYLIWVEPSSPANFDGLYAELGMASVEFLPEFFGDADYADRAKAPTVSVQGGSDRAGVDVQVTKTIANSEYVYAPGGQTDENGDRLVIKVEPDDTLDEATNLRDENRDGLITIADIIQEDGDVDVYSFQATRDDVWSVKVLAQEIGSNLVATVQVLGPGEQEVIIGEDTGTYGPGGVAGTGTDPEVIFTAPETNSYYVRIGDASDEGGERFYYTLVLERLSRRVPVSPLSPAVSVLSVPISDSDLAPVFTNPTFGNVEITELKVRFLDLDGDGGLDIDPDTGLPTDFRDPTIGGGFGAITSGFSVFRDTGTINGIFDLDPANPDQSTQDSSVRLSEIPTITTFGFGFEVTFKFGENGSEALRIPAQYVQDDIADIHVVIRTSLNIHHGDDFQVLIPANGIRLKVNTPSGAVNTTLFPNEFPPVLERNRYTGDIVELTTFIQDDAADIDAKSIDFPLIGINYLGDPREQYWISEVELTFVGFNLLNVIPFAQDRFFGGLPQSLPDNIPRTWEMTDLLPFTNGVITSGGVNLYFDNDPPGAPGDGVFNSGLDGDLLLGLAGAQRLEVISLDEVPDDVLLGLYPQIFSGVWGDLIQDIGFEGFPPESRAFLEEDEFLALRDELNLFAFKAIIPLDPSSAVAAPPNDTGVNAGPDIFITIRTSEDVVALDTFVPYIQVDGVKVSNDLSAVNGAGGDLTAASLVNVGSLRSIDPTTTPNTSGVITRPGPEFVIKDLVSPNDPANRVAVIGAEDQGAPPLAVIGFDASAYGSDAMRSPNPAGIDATDLINTGVVLDTLTVLIDPAERPTVITQDFLQPILVPTGGLSDHTAQDTDLLGLPANGMTLHVDDGTPPGDFLDNDLDGLFDEELINGSDDDLDGRADEPDAGDEDGTGIQGQLDSTDDVLAYFHNNDIWRGRIATHYVVDPVITQQGPSLRVDYTDLTARVEGESVGDFTLISDPFSIFSDDPFVRTDHFPQTARGGGPVADFGDGAYGSLQNGFYVEYDDFFFAEGGLLGDDIIFPSYSYSYVTQIPPSNTIPELQGTDYFIAMRAGPAARSGDTFRMRIPANGIGYSFFRDFNGEMNRPGSFPSLDFSSNQVRVGTGNTPPTLTFVEPANGQNEARTIDDEGRISFEYTVVFDFDDPDNTASADFFYDTDNFGVDGFPIPLLEDEIQQTSNVLDNNGERTLEFTFRFPPSLVSQGVAEVFIYAIVTDDVNPTRAVYSTGSIVLDEENRADFAIQDFIIADNVGRIYGTGGANVNIPDYRQSQNIIRDIELTPSSRGALFLTGFGEVVLRGDPDPWSEFVRTSDFVRFPGSPPLFFGADIARDLVPDFRRDAYYVLDGMGRVTPVGNAAAITAISAPIHPGEDLARDMEITPTGEGLLILSGNGLLTSLGDADTITGPSYGMDIARDMDLNATGRGVYILDGYGNVTALGTADPELLDNPTHPIYMGNDVYRAIEASPGDEGLLLMDRQGIVYAEGDVILGPNPVENGTVAPPPGLREGEPIDFTDPDTIGNVVTGEAFGAFIDLETTGLGSISRTIAEFITDGTNSANGKGLCQLIQEEDLVGLLSLFTSDFVDEQGHDLDDLAEVWQSFFDYYEVVLCRVPEDASLTVEANVDEADLITVEGVIQLMVLNPVLTTFAPADEPTELEQEGEEDQIFDEIGERFELGPIQYDQVVRFWEIGDGRGWEMNIVDDDYVEGQLDSADRHMVRRHFFKQRRDRPAEGAGSVYLEEEDGVRNSNNSIYFVQFIENVEAPSDSPEGGWNQPVVNFLWSDLIGDELPLSVITLPFSFNVRFLSTQSGNQSETALLGIAGGDVATFGVVPVHSEDVDEIEQNSSTELRDDMPGAWRFFDPAGVYADQRIDFYYETHLYFTEEGEFGGFEVVDPNSSAFLVNLTEVNWVFPNDTTRTEPLFRRNRALEADLSITPEEFSEIPLNEFVKTIAVEAVAVPGLVGATRVSDIITVDDPPQAIPTDFLITFRKDELGFPGRIYYATFKVTYYNTDALTTEDPDNPNNVVPSASIIWKFDPATDFVPGGAFKELADKFGEKDMPNTGSLKPKFSDSGGEGASPPQTE